jgi:outer membrane protein OmpA-like peptidoglycan-associated protein
MLKLLHLTVFLSLIHCSWAQVITVYFDHNSHTLSFSEQQKLSTLNNNATIDVTRVHAYCDSTGSVGYNQQLANKRAQQILTLLNLAQHDLELICFGKEYPISRSTIYNPVLWRKVEIYYTILNNDKDTTSETPAFANVEVQTEILSAFNDSLTLYNLIKDGEPIVLNILFIPGTNQLLDETSSNELWRLFYFLRSNSYMHAFIRGHVCCGSGGSLSYEHAYTVYQFLTQRGISPNRLNYKGFDNTLPISEETTDEERQKNRRVDVIFTTPNKEN